MAINTLDPAFNPTNHTLTNGNLTATALAASNFTNQNTRTVTPFTSGKIYFEFLANTVGGIPGMGVGIENPNNGNAFLGGTLYGWCYAAGNIVYNNGANVTTLATYTTNDIVCVAVSIPDKKLWFRKTSGNWNNTAGNDPATNVGGFDLTTLLANNGNVYPGINTWLTGDRGTFNFGASAFTYAIPSGFVALNSGGPVVLLCHCDGTNGSNTFTDMSLSAHPLTAGGGCTVSTANPKFGTGAAAFGGVSYIVTSGATSDYNFGSGQFTVEAWIYATSAPGGGTQNILTQWGGASNLGWDFGFNAGTLAFFYSTTGADNPSVSATFSPTLNQWYHVAVDRDASNVLRVYVNGAVIASGTVSATIFTSTQQCTIGNDTARIRGFPGYIDEIRITKGTAVYGGAFTPPTGPFPDPGATVAQARAVVLA